jgi:hypothetical protein
MMNCFAFTEFISLRRVPLGFGQSGNAMMPTLRFSRVSLPEGQVGVAEGGPVHKTPQLKEGIRE